MSTHLKRHFGEKPFSCPQCSKRFLHQSLLNLHLQRHKNERNFKCALCSKAFNCKLDLSTHIKIHSGEKEFSCPHCSKGFVHKRDLTFHIRTHTGEKPFSCSLCSRAFNSKGTLKHHVRLHTGEKPYACPHCPRTFCQNSACKSHIRNIHTKKNFVVSSVLVNSIMRKIWLVMLKYMPIPRNSCVLNVLKLSPQELSVKNIFEPTERTVPSLQCPKKNRHFQNHLDKNCFALFKSWFPIKNGQKISLTVSPCFKKDPLLLLCGTHLDYFYFLYLTRLVKASLYILLCSEWKCTRNR